MPLRAAPAKSSAPERPSPLGELHIQSLRPKQKGRPLSAALRGNIFFRPRSVNYFPEMAFAHFAPRTFSPRSSESCLRQTRYRFFYERARRKSRTNSGACKKKNAARISISISAERGCWLSPIFSVVLCVLCVETVLFCARIEKSFHHGGRRERGEIQEGQFWAALR